MLPLHDWLLLASVCALGAMAPGISLAVITRHTLHGGPRAGAIAGLAKDIPGLAQDKVKVQLEGAGLGFEPIAPDRDGAFRFDGLPPGRYGVTLMEEGNWKMKRRVQVYLRGGDVAQNGLEKGLQVRPQFGGQARLTGDGIGVHDRKVRLFVAGAQLDEQVKSLVQRPLRVGIAAVNLVDDDYGAVVHF